MSSVIYIYALVDPRTSIVRYVGASQKPKKRIQPARHVKGKNKRAWCFDLESEGLRPVLRILEEVPEGDDWEPREKFWIASFDGLLNESTGGSRGAVGVVRSEETRKKMSDASKGKPHNWTEDGRARAAATQFKPGVNTFETLSLDAQERIRAAGRRIWEGISQEERSRMATERNHAYWDRATSEERSQRGDKISEALLKSWENLTPEERAARQRRWAEAVLNNLPEAAE